MPFEIAYTLLSRKNLHFTPALLLASVCAQGFTFVSLYKGADRSQLLAVTAQASVFVLSQLVMFMWEQFMHVLTIERLIAIKDGLEEASTKKDALSAGIIHDLRNPTNVIINCIDLIQDGLERAIPREEIVEMVQIAQNCSEHVNTLVSNFLDFAKL